MKTFAGNRGLLIATISPVTATLPLAGTAQEEVLNDGQAPPQRSSQQRFVSDKLVLNVYAQPDQSSARVATIQTGDVVEELERSANLVRVRMEDGREGWGRHELPDKRCACSRTPSRVAAPAENRNARSDKPLTEEIARLRRENAALKTQVNELRGTWSGWLIAVVLTGALGYAGGYQTLARHIRRRFGGLKIY